MAFLTDVTLVDNLVAVRGRCPELITFRLNPVGWRRGWTAAWLLGI